MLINIETKQRVHEHEFRADHAEVSFPVLMTDADVNSFGHAVLNYPDHPEITSFQTVADAGEELVNGVWQVKWQVNPKGQGEIAQASGQLIKNLRAQIQADLDAFALTLGNDSMIEATSYSNSTVEKYRLEALHCIVLRDQTWLAIDALEEKALAENTAFPASYEALKEHLPVLTR